MGHILYGRIIFCNPYNEHTALWIDMLNNGSLVIWSPPKTKRNLTLIMSRNLWPALLGTPNSVYLYIFTIFLFYFWKVNFLERQTWIQTFCILLISERFDRARTYGKNVSWKTSDPNSTDGWAGTSNVFPTQPPNDVIRQQKLIETKI